MDALFILLLSLLLCRPSDDSIVHVCNPDSTCEFVEEHMGDVVEGRVRYGRESRKKLEEDVSVSVAVSLVSRGI